MPVIDTLQVNYEEHTVGWLHRSFNTNLMSFTYDKTWFNNNFSQISFSLPVRQNSFDPYVTDNFFGNLIPDSNLLNIIALNKKLSSTNIFSFLKNFGHEVAGALKIFPISQNIPKFSKSYKDVTDLVIKAIKNKDPMQNNLIIQTKAKLSLAGAQNKLAVLLKGDKILIPDIDSDAPTSHIIKPPSLYIKNIHFNEAFFMDLAKTIGLHVPYTNILFLDKVPIFIIERYDRKYNQNNKLTRIHQEDFCQALNFNKIFKYEADGGPSFRNCSYFLLTKLKFTSEELDAFIKISIFNYIIGNCDAHAKNFSIVYDFNLINPLNYRNYQLSPFYDLLSTTFYKYFSTELAMFIGSTKKHGLLSIKSLLHLINDFYITPQHFIDIFEILYADIISNISNIINKHIELYGNKQMYQTFNNIVSTNCRILSKQINILKGKIR
ncbi:MAG: HipA domain-containing protein [Deltaproteobacteria bacterium]|nr:HipA domain-containing protein [Deltaproteobacteria bacterium]